MILPKGFFISGINCGIKRKNPDLGLIFAPDFCRVQGVFTLCKNVSYSVTLCKKNIKNPIKALVINSGNANCFSHKTGLSDTAEIIKALAKVLGVNSWNVLIASTGIIGKRLPKEKIIKSFPRLIKKLGKDTSKFAASILTTDTFSKVSACRLPQAGGRITGFAKGAGMVCPNMATMLGFILTDCAINSPVLRKIFRQAVAKSFNSISVDGCMSTNDTVLILSSNKVPLKSPKAIKEFTAGLEKVTLSLAKMIVKDAEGATKFVEIAIKGAKSGDEAKKAGLALANSNLFKCALYGESTNWGRIISALGQAGITVGENISIKASPLKNKEIGITIDLKRGKSGWKIYTCDLTPKYVKINAEYS